MEVEVFHWRNQLWGMGRYDVWLWAWVDDTKIMWRVEAQRGGASSHDWWASRDIASGPDALALAQRIMAARADEWVTIKQPPRGA